jgi:hypothetical protein
MENLMGVGDGQTRGNPGVLPKKLGQKGRQEVCSNGHGGPDPEMALRCVLERANHLPGLLHLLDDRSGQRKELSSGFRQEDLLARPFEEADLQIFFQGFDLKAHCRLGQKKSFPCLGKALVFCDLEKDLELVIGHKISGKDVEGRVSGKDNTAGDPPVIQTQGSICTRTLP